MELPDHWVWRDQALAPGDAVVFDLDGVLSDASPRQHLLEGDDADWHAFFSAAGADEPLTDQIVLAGVLAQALPMVILTARPLRLREVTQSWLGIHGVPWHLLIMREEEAWSGSTDFKAEQVDLLVDRGFRLRLAFEDDPRNAAMYRGRGIPCVYIHSGYYQ